MSKLNLLGQKFNRLVVIGESPTVNRKTRWKCLCDCGKEVIVRTDHLKRNVTKSCGCLQAEIRKRTLNPRANYGNISERLKPVEIPTELDIAWAAGIYEGEGSVLVRGNCPTIMVSQKKDWILHKLQRLFGGSVCRNQGMFIWKIHGELARRFINMVWQYLSPRRKKQIKDKKVA